MVVFNSRKKEHFHELEGRRDVSGSGLSLALSLWSRILYSPEQHDLLNYSQLFDEKNGGWQLSTYLVCLKGLFFFLLKLNRWVCVCVCVVCLRVCSLARIKVIPRNKIGYTSRGHRNPQPEQIPYAALLSSLKFYYWGLKNVAQHSTFLLWVFSLF